MYNGELPNLYSPYDDEISDKMKITMSCNMPWREHKYMQDFRQKP